MNLHALNLVVFFSLVCLVTSCVAPWDEGKAPPATQPREMPPEQVPGRTSAPLHDPPILQIDTGGHKAIINDIIFTKDGRYLVSAADDKTVRVWDARSGEIVRIIRGQIGKGREGKIYAAALSPDNRWLAVGGLWPRILYVSSTSPPAGSNACSKVMRMSSTTSIFRVTAAC